MDQWRAVAARPAPYEATLSATGTPCTPHTPATETVSQDQALHIVGMEPATMDTEKKTVANPGDEAPPGTPGTGEDVCPECHGTGRIRGVRCENCGGTGKIIRAIGGA